MTMQHSRTVKSICLTGGVLILSLFLQGCILPTFDADCSGAEDCGSCLERSGCGWCGSCVPGTSWGADESTPSCLPEMWYWHSCSENSRACNDSCYWSNDGSCDEGLAGLCDAGTDCSDCRND